MAKARDKITEYEKKATSATGEARVKMDRQMVNLKQDLKAAEDKLGEMKAATVAKWKEFETGVGNAMARLRTSINKATS